MTWLAWLEYSPSIFFGVVTVACLGYGLVKFAIGFLLCA